MVMMSKHFIGAAPFDDVYITGLVRDAAGEKMSKSKGNILDPLDLIDGVGLEELVHKRTDGMVRPKHAAAIEKATRKQYPQGIPAFGADALRFTFASLAAHGRDIKFDLSRCEGYRNFCNKLWNASRFVLGACADFHPSENPPPQSAYCFADLWIISRAQRGQAAAQSAFSQYRFDLLAQEIYQLVWDEYCDWYLEIAKARLQDQSADADARAATKRTLLFVLEAILRLAHPLIPFITETLWQKVAAAAGLKTTESIMLAPYPEADESNINEEAEHAMASFKRITDACRRLRSDAGISPATKTPLTVEGDSAAFAPFAPFLPALAKIAAIHYGKPESAAVLVDDFKLTLEIKTDAKAERARIARALAALDKEAAAAKARLDNPQFTAKAPPAIVARRRERLAEIQREQSLLNAQAEKYSQPE
jgi:valyl-tRNA synthetase